MRVKRVVQVYGYRYMYTIRRYAVVRSAESSESDHTYKYSYRINVKSLGTVSENSFLYSA